MKRRLEDGRLLSTFGPTSDGAGMLRLHDARGDLGVTVRLSRADRVAMREALDELDRRDARLNAPGVL